MRASLALCAVAALVSLTPLTAQRKTWIVDASGGTGFDFREITPALHAAKPGDVIEVRRGTYNPFLVSKGVSILGSPGVIVRTSPFYGMRAVDLPVGQSLVLQGLESATNDGSLWVSNCAGSVLVQSVGVKFLRVERSTAVRVFHATLGGPFALDAVQVRSATVEFDRCKIVGGAGGLRGATGVGIDAVSSTISMSRCDVRGGVPAFFPTPPSSAIELRGTDVTIGDDGSGQVVSAATVATISGDGKVLLSPKARLSGGAIESTVRVTKRLTPTLAVDQSGSARKIDLHARPGLPYLTLVGLPTAPYSLRGIDGAFWFDLAGPVIVFDSGLLPATGRVVRSYQSTVTPYLGLHFVWQSAVFDGARFEMSNGAGYAVTR